MGAVARRGQGALPGVAPMCPHCGSAKDARLVAESETDIAVVEAERWECEGCGGVFWSLPSLRAARGAQGRR